MASDTRNPVDASSAKSVLYVAPQRPVPRARRGQDQLTNLLP